MHPRKGRELRLDSGQRRCGSCVCLNPTLTHSIDLLRKQYCSNDERHTVHQISTNHGPSATSVVNEQDTAELRNQSNDGGDALILQGFVARNPDLLENQWRVVLDRADAGHLH